MSRTRKCLMALLVAFIAFSTSMFVLTTFKANATEEFYMNGAGVRYITDEDDSTGIRFEARVSESLYDSVINDSNRIFGAFILPNDYLTNNDITSDSITNHKTQFGAAGIAYNECENLIKYRDNADGTTSIVYSITDIQYGNYNRDFFCLMYIKSKDSGTYQYAAANDKNVRIVAGVALAAYEAGEDDDTGTLLNYIFVADYELTDAVGSKTSAMTYASENASAVNSFKASVANMQDNYAAQSSVNAVKAEYNDLNGTAKTLVSNEYALIGKAEKNIEDRKVFGDKGLSGAMSNYTGNDTWRATTEHTVSSDYSTYEGQGGYVYDGEYGDIAKVTVNIGTSGISVYGTPVPEDLNWGLVVNFDEILDAMDATDAPHVRMFLYVNSSSNKWVQFGQSGTISRMAQSQNRASGWHEIVFSKSDIENIVDNCPIPMIWNNNAELSLESRSFELWISDFFLAKTEESVSAGNTQIELSTVSKGTDFAGRQYDADVSFFVANDAEHGRIVKAAISKGSVNNGYDYNWAFSVDFDNVLEAMNNTGAMSTILYVYLNVNENDDIAPWIGFGDNATRINAGNKSIGWNEIRFTKAQIQQLADLSTALMWNTSAFTYQGNCTYFEIWVSDFFLEYTDGRVFGDDGLSGAMSNYTGNDTWRATTEHTVSSDYSTYVGQGGYVYDGEYGDIAKVTVNIGTSGISYNGTPVAEDKNWGLVFSFNEVLDAMDATDSPNVRMFLYVNSSSNKWVQFGQSGTISRMAQSQNRAPGWHEIVFSKSDIENIVDNCPIPMIWNNNAELSLESRSFELWISDFFLAKTEESVSAGDTQIKLSTVSKDTVFAERQYDADVSFSFANDAEHGRIVKAGISKGSGYNWAFSVDFGKVLEAMNNTDATSAKLYVYLNINANDDVDKWVGFGNNYTRVNAGSKSIGWNEITFTKAQIQQLADLSTALIWNTNAFKYQGNCTYFEIWVSDFTLS